MCNGMMNVGSIFYLGVFHSSAKWESTGTKQTSVNVVF